MLKVQSELKKQNLKASVQLFSSLNKSGKDQAIEKLDEWFEVEHDTETE
jgi:GTP-binding protein